MIKVARRAINSTVFKRFCTAKVDSTKDLYKALEIKPESSQKEIKSAYKKLVKQHHPDRGGSQEKIKDINLAYETLSNSALKEEYDSARGYSAEKKRQQADYKGYTKHYSAKPNKYNTKQKTSQSSDFYQKEYQKAYQEAKRRENLRKSMEEQFETMFEQNLKNFAERMAKRDREESFYEKKKKENIKPDFGKYKPTSDSAFYKRKDKFKWTEDKEKVFDLGRDYESGEKTTERVGIKDLVGMKRIGLFSLGLVGLCWISWSSEIKR